VILAHILTDLFRDHTLSGGMKTLWVVFLVFLPFLAALVYLISRGKGMAERSAARQQQAQEQFEGYVQSVATTGDATATSTDQIAQAKQLLDAGTIDQAEFDRLKAKALT
jgi:Short C-terminal domain/Phospholipase_D-nuclease N-terminal